VTVDDAVRDVKREAGKRVEQVKEKARELRADAQKVRERIADRVNEVLARIEGVVPQADAQTPVPQRAAANSLAGFMDEVLVNVDGYWRRTFAAADVARPRVERVFIAPGRTVGSACGDDADDQAAFYCPADDTIYVGEGIVRDVLDNLGDFGVAYVIAHEYAHNVQQELGWFEAGRRLTTVAPFELQADCMAGTWAYAVYREGLLEEGDVEEAVKHRVRGRRLRPHQSAAPRHARRAGACVDARLRHRRPVALPGLRPGYLS